MNVAGHYRNLSRFGSEAGARPRPDKDVARTWEDKVDDATFRDMDDRDFLTDADLADRWAFGWDTISGEHCEDTAFMDDFDNATDPGMERAA